MQLLMNQAPISVLVMLYVIPVADDVTVWRDVGWGVYGLIGIVSWFLSLSLSLFKKIICFCFFAFLLFSLLESPLSFGERQTKKKNISLTRREKEWIIGLSDQSFAIRDYSRSWSCE